MNRQRSKRATLFQVGAALLTVWGGVIALGDSIAGNVREQREKDIAGKSEAERARLQRNFKAFRDLPAVEQEKLRQFDLQLKEDARNGGNLRKVMTEYYDWLATLTPGQAQDLREIDDPNRREKRVRELLKEQQEQADAGDSGKAGKSPAKLGPKDLAAVLEVIEQALREKHLLSQDDQQQLQNKKDLARLVYIVELAFRRQSVGPQGQLQWMSKDVMEAMLASISTTKLAKQVGEGQFPLERAQRLFRGIFAGIRAEVYEKLKPEQQDLELFFVQLKPTEQDEIMRLPFDQQQAQLTHMFIVKKSAEDPNAYPKPPQMPFWLRRPLGGVGPQGGRGAGNLRGRDGGAMRPPGANKKNNQKDRQKPEQKPDSE